MLEEHASGAHSQKLSYNKARTSNKCRFNKLMDVSVLVLRYIRRKSLKKVIFDVYFN